MLEFLFKFFDKIANKRYFLKNINKIEPDFISTGNIGCMTQIASGIETPIVHTVEVIDWLTGGPKPAKLNNL